MSINVAPGPEGENQDVAGYVLARWDRTARLCAILAAQAIPAIAAAVIAWLALH